MNPAQTDISAEPLDPEAEANVPLADTPPAEPEGDEQEQSTPIEPGHWRSRLRGLGACTISTIVHGIGLMILSLCMITMPQKNLPRTIVANPVSPKDEQLEEIQLDPDLAPSEQMTSAVSSSMPSASDAISGMVGAAGGAAAAQLDSKVVEKFAKLDNNISVEHPLDGAPAAKKLIEEVPLGFKGESRMIIDDYNQAFDIITQEIMWMLDRSDVLVIWCFDQSGSMKDDQAEIRARVEKVYHELGLTRMADGNKHLMSAVTSYGGGFAVHTPKPTSDFDALRTAISSVPEDPSGHEIMCEAVQKSIRVFRPHARRRQMALILVTDESGERDNNVNYLETTIAEAKSAQCKIYTLGREAVFGYPYAHMRYVHPQTKRPHWLRIDRGPESGFVEQLQTNGFRRRYEAFGSGFGPYEQTRMSRETGGIFFMLPSVETNLVRGHKRRYELEVLRAYKPDLRSRMEVFAERDQKPMRTFLWKVISDLNPYNTQAARVVEMRMAYSLRLDEFVKQARHEQTKAVLFIRYLGEVQKILEDEAAPHRQQEAEPRWQANYDLIYAQTIAYQARLYEYGAALEDFIKEPQTAPMIHPKNSNLHLVHWDIGTRKEVRVPEKSDPYIKRATELFNEVIKNHPETPWAERAKWELRRGFGVHLVPDYDPPYIDYPNPDPLPKL